MKVGDTLTGKVTGIKSYGAFIELENGTTGLVHISEIKTGYVDNIYNLLSLGQEVTVQVIDIDDFTQKASFSMRTLDNSQQINHPHHRFSKNYYKIGFKPLGDSLDLWIEEGLDYLQDKKMTD